MLIFLADMAKAKTKLDRVPKIMVEQICVENMANDLDSAKRHALLKKNDHELPVSFE
ncbi:MAG: GDPmannose 4,6-dehydratase [Oleiphilaceae bacterium]|jgi:GDPmannose 4,6-dehydratase